MPATTGMTIRRTILFTFCIMAIVPAFGQTRHDYETYTIILEDFLKQDGANKRLVLIQRESDTIFFGGDPTSPHFMGNLESLMKRQVMFSNEFKIKKRQVIVIIREEFRSLTIDGNGDLIWDPLYKRYPKAEGVIFLSPIYYTNEARTTGVLQIGIARDSLSSGYFLVKFDLRKRRKKITRTMTLVS